MTLQEMARCGAAPSERPSECGPAEHAANTGCTRFRLLAETLEQLSAADSSDKIMEIMHSATRQLTGAQAVSVVLREGDNCHYAYEDSPTGPLWEGQRFPLAACISGWVMLHHETAVIEDIYLDDRVPRATYEPTFVRSLVMAPVGSPEAFAAIGAYWATVRRPCEEEVEVLETLARAAGAALERHWAAESLRRRERHLSAIFSKAAVGLSEVSLDGRFRQVNGRLCQLLGRSQEQLLTMTVTEVTHPDDVPQSVAAMQLLVKTGEFVSLDKRYVSPDGTIIWANSSLTRIDDEHGKPVRILVVTVDLTTRKHAEDALRASEERYRTLFESIEEGFCIIDVLFDKAGRTSDCRFLEVNPAFEKHTGFEPAVGKTMRELVPELEDNWFEVYGRVVATGEPARFISYVNALKRWFSVYAFRIRHEQAYRAAVIFSDITQQKKIQEELQVSNERLKLAIEGAGDGVWDWDIRSNTYVLYDRSREILECIDEEDRNIEELWRSRIHPEDYPRVRAALIACLQSETPSYACEYRVRRGDGSWKWVWSRGTVVARNSRGKPLRMTGVLTDISERKEADERIWHHANFDALTGLPNRRLFRDRLDQEVRKAQRSGCQIGLLFLDLDRFKQVNDLLGHDAGDSLLAEAARRIVGCVRGSDTVARLGGDEFTVILSELKNLDHVEQVCQDILEKLANPFQLGKEVAYVSGSAGISIYPEDATTAEELIRKADQAMYVAKSAGKNQFSYFTRAMDEKAHLRLRLANELRSALHAGQLEVHYQPVIDLCGGQIVKAEALLRWHHPKFGLVEPSRFIPLAEESGMIGQIGDWVFKEAASCSKRWGEQIGMPFQIGVNKSPIQFLSRGEEGDWLGYLEQLGLGGDSIAIEITEGLLLHASAAVSDKLLQYRDAGVQVAIDDFGTGYSSMAYLKKFHIDYLKIDQSFVSDMAVDPGNRTIAESIIVMAHKLGLKVIAEGIETQEQKDLLAAAGCDYGQGFLFSYPVPAIEFEAMLTGSMQKAGARPH